jgi:hypothetical protein
VASSVYAVRPSLPVHFEKLCGGHEDLSTTLIVGEISFLFELVAELVIQKSCTCFLKLGRIMIEPTHDRLQYFEPRVV